ncbi:MAG: glycoside hydrolase family 43 protein [Planctomycetota bacterium]|jgi:hypothetical protein
MCLGAFITAAQGAPGRSFEPGAVWPDTDGVHINAHGGGMLHRDGTYYWFGEHKIEGSVGNKAHVGVSCYSSKDLHAWRNEGTALEVTDDPASDIAAGCVLERPKVIYNEKTSKYVMWFHLELRGQGYRSARSGVAASDRVTGPYTFIESFRPNRGVWPGNAAEKEREPGERNFLARDFHLGQMARDMTLFVDDDGKAYHLYASEENCTMHVSLLTDDYLRPSGKYGRIFIGRHMEAPAVFKCGGRYWFMGSGCTGWRPNAARSAVADSMWGPWRELGNPCVGAEAGTTFDSQSTYILPVAGRKDAFIYMGDRWRPRNAIDGRYVWLPVRFEGERFVLSWLDRWDLSFFDPGGPDKRSL